MPIQYMVSVFITTKLGLMYLDCWDLSCTRWRPSDRGDVYIAVNYMAAGPMKCILHSK